MSKPMSFEQFANDHSAHVHCIGCNGCILDPRQFIQENHPIWCVGCRERIKKNSPPERWPWAFEVTR